MRGETVKNIFLVDQAKQLELARRGDQDSFAQLIEPYHHELLVHCYRILGSFEDAEDLLQEALLRAWRGLDSFEGRSSLRAWFYKIATNACLDALASRRSRGLPRDLYPRGDPTQPLPKPTQEVTWIEPFPDELLDSGPNIYPEARYDVRESVTLAFVAALQRLPGRQRAVLLLRDVLGWDSSETAQILDMTRPSVNSALQRARQTLKQSTDGKKRPSSTHLDEELSSLLTRYVEAWEAADTAALLAVVREDVALTMPPFPVWFSGCDDIRIFLDGYLFQSIIPFKVRLQPTRANGSPAFAVYQMDAAGVYRPAALQILTIQAGQVIEINDFLIPGGELFSRFGLPIVV